MRRLMALLAFWRRSDPVETRMAKLEERGQLAVDAADAAVVKAHRITLAEARVKRENEQYLDRLHDRKGSA